MEQRNYTTGERKWKQLDEKERYRIETLWQQGYTPTSIGAALTPRRDRRTIERELARGMTLQRRSDLTEHRVYLADVGQRKHEERASNKGCSLKIDHDHKPAEHIERKIKEEKWSPDAIIGQIKVEGLVFDTELCTKTVYNYIDKGIFSGISNHDLWIKKDGKEEAIPEDTDGSTQQQRRKKYI